MSKNCWKYFFLFFLFSIIKLNIELFERVNVEKLQKVLRCDNIPFENGDDTDWKQKFLSNLLKYSKEKITKKGIKKIYRQEKKYGRYYSGCSLQTFQKEVRKYISGEFYQDLDFKSCHAQILKTLLEKEGVYGLDVLDLFIKDKNSFFEKYQTDKISFIKMINNEEIPKPDFRDIHQKIYKILVPKLKINNNVLYTRIKKQRTKEGKDYNYDGSFLAHFLQNIENQVLMVMFDYLNNKGYIVGSLMFDGLMVEKNENLINEFPIIEQKILLETGYPMKIVEKSTTTDWKPNELEKIDFELHLEEKENEEFSCEKNNDLYDQMFEENLLEEERKKNKIDFINYLNQFLCLFENPHSYGWRWRKNENYSLSNPDKVSDRIGKTFIKWKETDLKLKYRGLRFIVDENKNDMNYYNLYKRPEYILPKNKTIDSTKHLKEISPNLADFLFRIISAEDERVYIYLINYISKMVQVGKTMQLIALKGKKGCGKSSFCDILRHIIGDKYYIKIDDINQISNNFNALYENVILTSVEEIIANAGEYNHVQSKLKTLTTEVDICIEKKGIDAYKSLSMNNYVLCTNELNPIKITKDNRRNLVLEVSCAEQNNYTYFKNLKKQIQDNIEVIRGFFYSFDFVDDLNSIRPMTNAELALLELNMNITEQFIEEEMEKYLQGELTCEMRKLDVIYSDYCLYCKNQQKKSLAKNYFSQFLRDNGFEVNRYTTNGERSRFVKEKEKPRKISFEINDETEFEIKKENETVEEIVDDETEI